MAPADTATTAASAAAAATAVTATVTRATAVAAPVVIAPVRWRAVQVAVALWRLRGSVRFGLIVVASMVVMALFAPLLAPYGPDDQDLAMALTGPSAQHWLGTDNVGRDLVTRLIYGARVPLVVAFVSTVMSALIGVTLSLLAGFISGWVDAALMRITDAFLCFPPLIFVLLMSAHLGPGIHNVILSFVLFGWTGFARITRGQVLVVRELQFIEAARAIGMSRPRLLWRHVLPNVMTPIIVACSNVARLLRWWARAVAAKAPPRWRPCASSRRRVASFRAKCCSKGATCSNCPRPRCKRCATNTWRWCSRNRCRA